MHKKIFFSFIILLSCLYPLSIFAQENEQKIDEQIQEGPSFTVSVQPKKFSKTRLLLALVGEVSSEFSHIIEIIKKDLEFSGQFDVDVRALNLISAKNDVQALSKEGYAVAIFFNAVKNASDVEWRIYDTLSCAMLKGSKYARRGSCLRGWAHNITDSIWSVLTSQDGFFSTKIAYCKAINQPRKRKVMHVYVADYDGSNEQLLVSNPTVNVAPRWNNDAHNPLLFYSEYTNSNVRLIAVNMDKKRKVASNYDGVNMCPSFSPDGKHVIYCASKGKGNCQLYYYAKGDLKKLTNNSGNNVSPTFSEDGKKVFFCSDFQTGQPQIYCYEIDKEALVRLTDSGYCASPNYCAKNHKVAYSKIVQGVMQVFVYDTIAREHTQITYDAGHKEECSWSPCGNWLLFGIEHKGKSKIALLNLHTNARRFITGEKQMCSYPAWSPVYEQFPVVV